MFNLALLATAHAQAGDVEEACVIGVEASALASGLRSTRATDYLRVLRRELSAHRHAPAVTAFEAAVSPLLTKPR